MTKISASLLASNTAYLGEAVKKLEKVGVDLIHMDITDGHYVDNLTFGPLIVRDIRPLTRLPIEAHLGMYNPEKFIHPFADAGADIITLQLDTTTHPLRAFRKIKSLGKKAGVAINPCRSIDEIKYFYKYIDYLSIMGVEPGFGGQTFEEINLDKIREVKALLKSLSHDIPVGVDGGVNFQNYEQIKQAGADVLVIGTSLFSQNDFAETVRRFRGSIS